MRWKEHETWGGGVTLTVEGGFKEGFCSCILAFFWDRKKTQVSHLPECYSSIAEVSGHPIALTLGLALIIHPLLAPSRGLGLSVVRLLLQLTSTFNIFKLGETKAGQMVPMLPPQAEAASFPFFAFVFLLLGMFCE